MKQFQTSCMLLLAASLFFLSSCGDGGEQKANSDTATVAPPETPVVVNTIDSTEYKMVTIMHRVTDFNKWLQAYEGHDSARLANGLHNYVIGRGLTDSNMVLIGLRADDFAKAKAFSQSANLKEVMKKAGVTGAPEIHFSVVKWQDTANVGSIPRAMTMFAVKDKDAWRKVFDDGAQERKDAGIMMRNVAHDADNPNNIRLVSALSDTAKAFAYYKSDAMKKRMADGGMIGEPKRFIFTIAKRY
jgi:quinol monooxygenase YgiN